MGKSVSGVYRDEPLEIRLWGRIAINDKTGCWEWTGNVIRPGNAGHINIAEGRSELVTHVIFEMLVGDIPNGKEICHHCDNGLCVRPSHIYAGTHAENMRDCANRHRAHNTTRCGELSTSSKLKLTEVVDIRRRHRNGESSMSLSLRYGVSVGQIQKIVKGQRWMYGNVTRSNAGHRLQSQPSQPAADWREQTGRVRG